MQWENIPCYILTVTPENNPGKSLQMTINELRTLGVDPIVVHRERDPECGRRGCYQSHQYLAQLLLNSNDQYICIFEEDAELMNHQIAKDALEKFQTIQRIDPEWDWISLGSLFEAPAAKYNSGIYKSKNLIETHAYILSRKGAQKIISWPYVQRPFDAELNYHDMNVYILRPSVFLQRHIYPNKGGGIDMKYMLTRVGLGNFVKQVRLMQEEGTAWKVYLLLTILFLAIFGTIYKTIRKSRR